MKITISEALNWGKTLKERHTELVALRNQNSSSSRSYYGANADKHTEITPKYDVKKLDSLITRLAREQRLLDDAVKRTNAQVQVIGYEQNDAVLGELEE